MFLYYRTQTQSGCLNGACNALTAPLRTTISAGLLAQTDCQSKRKKESLREREEARQRLKFMHNYPSPHSQRSQLNKLQLTFHDEVKRVADVRTHGRALLHKKTKALIRLPEVVNVPMPSRSAQLNGSLQSHFVCLSLSLSFCSLFFSLFISLSLRFLCLISLMLISLSLLFLFLSTLLSLSPFSHYTHAYDNRSHVSISSCFLPHKTMFPSACFSTLPHIRLAAPCPDRLPLYIPNRIPLILFGFLTWTFKPSMSTLHHVLQITLT